MRELILNAWPLGWQNYTNQGKLAVLLLAGLLWFWFGKKEHRQRYATLIIYATVMAVMCILPITAALLMCYQTRFYDYQWIWNLVPSTIVTALAGTLLWTGLMEQYGKQKGKVVKCVGITLALIGVICFCGRMGLRTWDVETDTKMAETTVFLEAIRSVEQQEDIVLWAPRDIMGYTRMLDSSVQLVYGRNMWDPSLSTYSYDTYSRAVTELYEWMLCMEKTGFAPEGTDCRAYMEKALAEGVNHIFVPEYIWPPLLEEMETALDVKAEKVANFYWLHVK